MDRFIYEKSDSLNKYKIYAIYYKGKIIYIGCTSKTLRYRMVQHFNISIFSHPKKGKQLFFKTFNDKPETIEIKCLYSFNNKISVNIVERLIINFYKRFVDASILNNTQKFNEDFILNPHLYSYSTREEVI